MTTTVAPPDPTNDPLDIVRALDAAAISERIEQLSREQDALGVLLRAARRRKPEPISKPERTSERHVR